MHKPTATQPCIKGLPTAPLGLGPGGGPWQADCTRCTQEGFFPRTDKAVSAEESQISTTYRNPMRSRQILPGQVRGVCGWDSGRVWAWSYTHMYILALCAPRRSSLSPCTCAVQGLRAFGLEREIQYVTQMLSGPFLLMGDFCFCFCSLQNPTAN